MSTPPSFQKSSWMQPDEFKENEELASAMSFNRLKQAARSVVGSNECYEFTLSLATVGLETIQTKDQLLDYFKEHNIFPQNYL